MPSREEIIANLTAAGPLELTVDDSQGYPIRVYRNAPTSLREVLLATRAHGGRPFLIYEDETLSYEELNRPVGAPLRTLVPLAVPAASAEEMQAHEAMLAIIVKASGGRCLWAASEVREGAAAPAAFEPQRSSA